MWSDEGLAGGEYYWDQFDKGKKVSPDLAIGDPVMEKLEVFVIGASVEPQRKQSSKDTNRMASVIGFLEYS